MGFIEKQAEQFVLEELLFTLETLEEDINSQNRQINELIKEESGKLEYITNDVNIVKGILVKLNYEELKALQTIFYEIEQQTYMYIRTDEEQEAFVKGLAAEFNDLPTATIGEDGEEEEDDWTIWNDEDEE